MALSEGNRTAVSVKKGTASISTLTSLSSRGVVSIFAKCSSDVSEHAEDKVKIYQIKGEGRANKLLEMSSGSPKAKYSGECEHLVFRPRLERLGRALAALNLTSSERRENVSYVGHNTAQPARLRFASRHILGQITNHFAVFLSPLERSPEPMTGD